MGLPQHPCWRWSFCTSWKLRLVDFGKVIIIARCLWFLSLLHPKIESHWIQTPLCVMNVHICPRVHWNRPPFEMDTGFSAIGVANGYWFPLPFHVCWNEVSGIFFFEWAAVLAVLSESTSVLPFAVDQKTTPWSGFRKSLCQIYNSELHGVQH